MEKTGKNNAFNVSSRFYPPNLIKRMNPSSHENSILKNDPLILGAKKLFSRILVGTGKYSSLELMRDCHVESQTEMVTLALRARRSRSRSRPE